MAIAKATFAAGCFWGVEDTFRQIPGVLEAVSGYTGGHLDEPSYEDVCYKNTGHAEAVEVSFDPDIVGYGDLLDAFWRLHDPTTLNRQGPDVGSQYRSGVFFHTPEQQQLAAVSKQSCQDRLSAPIVTEIVPAGKFWPAEDYHQRYFEKRGISACHKPA